MFHLYVCYHILSAHLSFYVILGYDIKIKHFMIIMHNSNNIIVFPFYI